MKVKAKNLSEKQQIEILDALYTAAGALKGRDAMKSFLRDLLTESERIMLGRRILIAQKLLEGQSGRAISESLNVGLDTVWRVERWLQDQMPGYEQAIRGMKKEFGKRIRRTEQKKIWTALKRKYPLHFLLFNAWSAASASKGNY